MSNVETAYQYFVGKGFTPAQSAGIVGNLEQESGVNPESVQPGGAGRGIAQWSQGGRWIPSLMTGNQAIDLQAQEQYIIDELQQNPGYGLAALQAATTPTQAAQVFGTNYERYGIAGARVADAQQVYNEAQQNGWPTASSNDTGLKIDGQGTVSVDSTNATLDSSAAGDLWNAVKNTIVPGSGLIPGLPGAKAISDAGKIGEEIATALGLAAQKEPQQLKPTGFLASVDELLNPSVSLFAPWNALTMAMSRGGLALLGMAIVLGGFAAIIFGTGWGRSMIGDTIKGVRMAAM